jgi:hypothetical protein
MQARTVINQCYIVREKLGEDGFCELWRATSVFNATEFLLRFLKPLPGLETRLEAFRAEMMAAYDIGHPAVADVVEFEQFEGRYFLVSAYHGQRPLRFLNTEGLRVGLEHLCRYVLELAEGVDAFHGLGIVYRCLNSDNALFRISQGRAEAVQVQKPGYTSLVDLLPRDRVEDWRETWAYMAPEIKKDSETVDQRADVYSLGIHLFRFLAGRLPYPDDGDFLRKEAASLAHVTKALTRRGVPEDLIRIAIRALRPDPALRYPDCLRFIAELRDFTDDRRAQSLRHEGVDPLANMETLNRAGGRIGASQIVRSLDTADYFRLLSETPPEPAPAKPLRLFPFTGFSDPEAVSGLEAAEAAVLDKGDLDEDDYIGSARKTVEKEPWAIKDDGPPPRKRPSEEPLPEPSPPPAPEEPEEPKPTPVPAPVSTQPVAAPAPSGLDGLVLEAPRQGGRKPKPLESKTISWKGGRLPQRGLVEIFEADLAKARNGRGSFRFIEEPRDVGITAALARCILRLRSEALVLDAGAIKKGADTTDLLRMIRGPLAKGLGGENSRTKSLLARRLSSSGGEQFWAASPVGALLYGSDLPEPDPDFVDGVEGAIQIARTLAVFGRRTKPLVLVMRNGEAPALSAHRTLLELARIAPGFPFCCFVFFDKDAEVPSWHALSKLEGLEARGAD